MLSSEIDLQNPINYSEGMVDEKERFIQYLAEQQQEDELTIKAMKLVLEDFMNNQKSLDEQMASFHSKLQVVEDKYKELQQELVEERKKRKSAERNAKNLQKQLDYARREQFGDRRQCVRNKDKLGKPAPSELGRQDEQDKYDGMEDTLCTDSVDKNESRNEWALPQKERDLRNRSDGYKTIGVMREAIEHPSDLSKVPGHIIERRMVRVFAFRTFLIEKCFEMVHYTKLGKQCDNSLHYGSDSGAEMAATYHSVIGTIKLHGSSIWNFIGTFFKNIFNGCRDYVNRIPAKITLATSQC